jgi:hypothetical protein
MKSGTAKASLMVGNQINDFMLAILAYHWITLFKNASLSLFHTLTPALIMLLLLS